MHERLFVITKPNRGKPGKINVHTHDIAEILKIVKLENIVDIQDESGVSVPGWKDRILPSPAVVDPNDASAAEAAKE